MPSNHLPTAYQEFIALSRYARWDDTIGRRETWEETVSRYMNFFDSKKPSAAIIAHMGRKKIEEAILELRVMPSMRALMTAGPALDRCHIAGYNCAYLPVNNPICFDEAFYILLCGTGVGYSVERQEVAQLPVISERMQPTSSTIIVEDSKEGWALALRQLLAQLYAGFIPKIDTSLVRPAGSRLVTFGGRASGPGPLQELFTFAIALFKQAAGRKLTSIEAHDLMCKVAEIVVVGGVRRAALICFSNLSDERMRDAKTGQWWEQNPQRALANNSYAATERPDVGVFMEEWTSLYKSKSGERGIFNREAAKKQVAKYGRRDPDHEFGSNPCCEIILRPFQFCNLTEIVARSNDNLFNLGEKAEVAAALGTMQATLTHFPYLRDIWSKNTKEEALLGVSMTGIMDCKWLHTEATPEKLNDLRLMVLDTNKECAALAGINQSTSNTCVKPSGTVSQLVDSASGIHGRYAPFYIRRVRGDAKDPMTTFMQNIGIPNEPCVNKPKDTVVFSFPMRAPKGSVLTSDLTALQHLDFWKKIQDNWCEHKPSITVEVKEHEWPTVGAWVWQNFDQVSGISFLPAAGGHTYRQAPYEEITEDEYGELLRAMPTNIDWTQLAQYEQTDNTTSSQTLACTGGVCEIVDLQS